MDVDKPKDMFNNKASTRTMRMTITKQPFYYFAITMVADTPNSINPQQYHDYIMLVINQWLGAIGGGMSVDILDFNYPDAIIRVPYEKYKSVWQAMTVTPFKRLEGAKARFQVLRSSAFAMGVAASSREIKVL
ncbi:hypothetical protein GGI25_002722 [Coemansia spiralis]|uniref:Ribonucleases P/MRP subunit Pop8-like domain-containing protein n=2 Tax=Coemansia TaxID=4863 RepID=A0A9W8G364_9FUNG|nr:hypothetical protein BX070DRAFT_252287 [Coemansia spiralis]KAJ1993530.1 hypothetical protein EDC05_002157 [Coemansia umbellata]KAJ2625227.1 hypothetical protein GGI26_000696 [Coemansia sp. RSA 1358]KAJ2677933.1 hypothetical protein GGI25_002722 [Coemansia spiralis]